MNKDRSLGAVEEQSKVTQVLVTEPELSRPGSIAHTAQPGAFPPWPCGPRRTS